MTTITRPEDGAGDCERRSLPPRMRGLRAAVLLALESAANPRLLLSRALTKGDEQLVQLIERLDHRIGCSGAGGVERFL